MKITSFGKIFFKEAIHLEGKYYYPLRSLISNKRGGRFLNIYFRNFHNIMSCLLVLVCPFFPLKIKTNIYNFCVCINFLPNFLKSVCFIFSLSFYFLFFFLRHDIENCFLQEPLGNVQHSTHSNHPERKKRETEWELLLHS